MLKKETLDLLNSTTFEFKDVFSICIGNAYLHQVRLIDYLGKYKSWNTDVTSGILQLDDKNFNVEYIGTTSKTDNFWYSAEIETVIPDEYVNMMISVRKNMQSLNLGKLTEPKIELSEDVNGYNLSMVYVSFANENVACYCGNGDTSIYMFMKDLPKDIFAKMNSVEFSIRVLEILSIFNVEHRLMVKALLIENEIEYTENENFIIAKFTEESIITVEFDENGLIKRTSGNLSM